ncbi:MAG: ATP synthase subunit I [Polyangiaceae bacterium]|nr:ATP synthase subunit I [Polyangiaceae bacterium]
MSKKEDDAAANDSTLKAALKYVAATGLAFSVIAAVVEGIRFGLGVFAGAVIALVNLIVLARIVEAFLTKKGNTAPWAIIAVLKLFFLLGGVWLLMKSEAVSGVALVAGYMSLPVGAVIASLFGPKPPEDTKEP